MFAQCDLALVAAINCPGGTAAKNTVSRPMAYVITPGLICKRYSYQLANILEPTSF
jgi:hypothetical protein